MPVPDNHLFMDSGGGEVLVILSRWAPENLRGKRSKVSPPNWMPLVSTNLECTEASFLISTLGWFVFRRAGDVSPLFSNGINTMGLTPHARRNTNSCEWRTPEFNGRLN